MNGTRGDDGSVTETGDQTNPGDQRLLAPLAPARDDEPKAPEIVLPIAHQYSA